MLSSRLNQENAVYQQQTAAAAKPLNQGIKGLAPKTPGNKAPKTPFKPSLNDENATLKLGKTNGKGGKAQQDAFVTPVGPRTRAPLGNKTTNAKATAFRTPVAVSDAKARDVKHTSPRLKRSKIQVHQAAELITHPLEEDAEEPEIEYMPPREVPLPDYPDDGWPLDKKFPQFEGANLTRGWWTEFAPGRDSDADSLGDWEEFRKQVREAEAREKSRKQQQEQKASTALKPTTTTERSSTIKATDAASALSSRAKAGSTPSFAASTAAAKARRPTTMPKKQTAPSTAASSGRFTAAKMASNSAIGYTKGRNVSAARKMSAGKGNLKEVQVKAPSAPPISLQQLFGDSLYIDGDEHADDIFDTEGLPAYEDDLDDFQLEMPEA